MFVATLDTSVLVPGLLRDALLTLAGGGMFDPRWSPRIEDELRHAVARLWRHRGWSDDRIQAYVDRLIEQMDLAFPDACVEGWEHLEGSYGVPDPDDEHVVALADFACAGVIVTDNLRDFRDEHLPGELHSLGGGSFLSRTVEVNPARAAAELEVMASRRGLSLGDLIDLLVMRAGLERDAADLLRPHADVTPEPASDGIR